MKWDGIDRRRFADITGADPINANLGSLPGGEALTVGQRFAVTRYQRDMERLGLQPSPSSLILGPHRRTADADPVALIQLLVSWKVAALIVKDDRQGRLTRACALAAARYDGFIWSSKSREIWSNLAADWETRALRELKAGRREFEIREEIQQRARRSAIRCAFRDLVAVAKLAWLVERIWSKIHGA